MDRLQRPDGMEIPFVVQGHSSGPSLVFAHGLMGTGEVQRAQLTPLVDAGWTVVTFDQRGHGAASPVFEPDGYDPEGMGADLWAVADAAGLQRCWIGGGSRGAATSFRAARLQPDRVEGLIQVVPALRDEPHAMILVFDALADRVRDAGIAGLIELIREFSASLGRGDDELFLDQLRTHDPASLEIALRAVSRWILPNVPAGCAEHPHPVVVLGWDNDPIHPLQTARDVAAAAAVDLIEIDQAAVFADRTMLGRLLVDVLATART